MTSGPTDIPRGFMMDHMIIRLGKYFRIIGYDAEWDLGLRTHELILKANASGRIFITRNTRIREQYPPVIDLIVLTETDPVQQFNTVVRQLALDVHGRLFSRCIRCNIELTRLANMEEAQGHVHPNVFSRQERFFRCPRCKTLFWHGSHVANTCRKLGLPHPDQ
jgi:uncharacterized protein